MKLYYSPGASSLASHIALAAAGVPYELARVNLATKQVDGGGDYLAVSEKGSVPALVLDDGGVLTENAVILQYVADLDPGSALAPAHGTFARYRLAEWLNYLATEIHKGFGPLWNPRNPDEVKAAARAALARRFDYVEKRIASTPYLMGDTFTVADAYLFTLLEWTKRVAIDDSRWPTLRAFSARVGALAAVRRAMREEGLPA